MKHEVTSKTTEPINQEQLELNREEQPNKGDKSWLDEKDSSFQLMWAAMELDCDV